MVTDTSSTHSGKVVAYNQYNLQNQPHPASKELQNRWWCWSNEKNDWRPRECRCFYIRTDRPGMARTSLEILAGTYIGNCTTIMNWNGACWIEEIYKSDDHKYAPVFKVNTPYFEMKTDTERQPLTEAASELINCDNGYAATGDAYFEVYGGKFVGVYNQDLDQCQFYDPTEATHDKDKDGKPSNWVADGWIVDKTHATEAEDPYYLVRKAD